jgi:hypothetical protein
MHEITPTPRITPFLVATAPLSHQCPLNHAATALLQGFDIPIVENGELALLEQV